MSGLFISPQVVFTCFIFSVNMFVKGLLLQLIYKVQCSGL